MCRTESLLFLAMASALADGSAVAQGPAGPGVVAKKPNEPVGAKAIRDKLSRPVTLENGVQPNTSLRDAREFISDQYEVTILVDTQAFKAEGIDAIEEMPVRLSRMVGVKLSTVLRLLLAQIDATYLIRSSHIEITTSKHAWPEFWRIGERNLAPRVNIEFEKRSLHEALQELSDSSGISVVVDSRASDKAKTSVTATLNNVPIDTAVLILADMADLRSVTLDNVLYVTTKENAELLRARQESFAKPK
jgi:hypothetical protein